MITNLRRKTSTPALTGPGHFLDDFSGEGDARDWVQVRILGYFMNNGRHCIEFVVIPRPDIMVSSVTISNNIQHEIRIEVGDPTSTDQPTGYYHLDAYFDPVNVNGWSISYHVEKTNRRRTWKMTKAQAGIPPKR